MPRPLFVRWLLATSAVACLATHAHAQSCGPCDPCNQGGFLGLPMKVDCKFQFNVKFGQSAVNNQNKAPWYSYFPVGPGMDNMNPTQPNGGTGGTTGGVNNSGQGSRFPNWQNVPAQNQGCPTCSQSNYLPWTAPPSRSSIVLTSGNSAPSYAWQAGPYPQYPPSQLPAYGHGR